MIFMIYDFPKVIAKILRFLCFGFLRMSFGKS